MKTLIFKTHLLKQLIQTGLVWEAEPKQETRPKLTWPKLCLYVCVWELSLRFMFPPFFFPLRVNSNLTWFPVQGTKITVYILFITVHNIVHVLKNIKNGSQCTIHTFKNYLATMFSVFSFSNNKFNPNEPYVCFFLSLFLFVSYEAKPVCTIYN